MPKKPRIITISLSPAWDSFCFGENLGWGKHAKMENKVTRPAGKALNVSRALAWMGVPSTAGGLWGKTDYPEMSEAIKELRPKVKLAMTAVKGRTRENISVIDTVKEREMHMRFSSDLATPGSISKLKNELKDIIRPGDICLIAGSLPGGNAEKNLVALTRMISKMQAKLILDSSGPMFKTLVNAAKPYLIKPNVLELRELLGENIPDRIVDLINAARQIMDEVYAVLISRGSKGALLVTAEMAVSGSISRSPAGQIGSTVACGDYMLAGFIAELYNKNPLEDALKSAIKAGTARAYGLESASWSAAARKICVAIKHY